MKCKNCKKSFYPLAHEVRRGNGKFCSRSCAATYNNAHRAKHKLTCQVCKKPFTSTSINAKYCSKECKQKAAPVHKYSRSTLARRVQKYIGNLACSVCGWNEGSVDIHHIIPKSAGGTDDFSNLALLCPNHHRLAHEFKLKKIISLQDLKAAKRP